MVDWREPAGPDVTASFAHMRKLVFSLCLSASALCVAGDDDLGRLHPLVKSFFDGNGCDKVRYCGVLVEVSCHPEKDGLVTYFSNLSGQIVMHCGGACSSRSKYKDDPKVCKSCPPLGWTCPSP